MYNLLVSAITGGTYEILNVLVGNIRMQESMTSLVLGLGQLMRTVMAAGAQWVTRNWSECGQTPALIAEIVASEDTHRCLENGPGLYRALDLSVVADDMATVVERAVSVFVRVPCGRGPCLCSCTRSSTATLFLLSKHGECAGHCGVHRVGRYALALPRRAAAADGQCARTHEPVCRTSRRCSCLRARRCAGRLADN